MKHYCIVGGGLTGLSTAFFLRQRYPSINKVRISLVESSDRYGGWIQSVRHADGAVYELGPRSVRFHSPTAPYMLHLVEQLGLSSRVIPVHGKSPGVSRRFVYVNNKLHELKPTSFITQTPFSRPLWLSALLCLLSSPPKASDITVDEFFRTRLGDEVADYLLNPILRGIYAGDTKHLGLGAVFPDLLRYEKNSPNFLIGYLIDSFRNWIRPVPPPIQSLLLRTAQKNGWVVWSLDGGLQTLVDALTDYLKQNNVKLFKNTSINCIHKVDSNFLVESSNNSIEADHILLATPARETQKLLQNISPEFSSLYDNIPTVDLAVVILEFAGQICPINGFGHLIPSSEVPHVLGVIYDSCVFPQTDCKTQKTSRFTCMIGGAWFKQYCSSMSNDGFKNLALQTLNTQLGIQDQPIRSCVVIHKNCIPQYGLHHKTRVSDYRQLLINSKLPISILGSSYDGVSVNDCVASAFRTVKNV